MTAQSVISRRSGTSLIGYFKTITDEANGLLPNNKVWHIMYSYVACKGQLESLHLQLNRMHRKCTACM